jgi:hypothetical protein
MPEQLANRQRSLDDLRRQADTVPAKSSTGVQSPRIDETRSPLATTSKGFVIVGTNFAPSSVKFKPPPLSASGISRLDAPA